MLSQYGCVILCVNVPACGQPKCKQCWTTGQSDFLAHGWLLMSSTNGGFVICKVRLVLVDEFLSVYSLLYFYSIHLHCMFYPKVTRLETELATAKRNPTRPITARSYNGAKNIENAAPQSSSTAPKKMAKTMLKPNGKRAHVANSQAKSAPGVGSKRALWLTETLDDVLL